jgi:alpha-mannosidase
MRELANIEFAPSDIRPLIRGVADGRVLGLAVQRVRVKPEGSEVHVDLVLSERGAPNLASVEAGIASLERALEKPGLARVRLRARFATRIELEVAVPDLPPHGYRALGLRPAQPGAAEPRLDEGVRISNERLEIEAAPDGTVTLLDRGSGLRLTGLLRLRDRADRGDSYNFCPLDGDAPAEKPAQVRVRRERSALRERLEIDEVLRVPRRLSLDRTRRTEELVDLTARVAISLFPGVPWAEVEISLENHAEDHRLQCLFPLGGRVEEAAYDGHFEVVRRPTEVPEGGPDWQERPVAEQPMRAFVAAKPEGFGAGLLVAARGLREASVSQEGVIALTLLRCFGWLSRDDLATRVGPAGPLVPTPGGQCPGSHAFALALVPFGGDPRDAAPLADAFRAGARGAGTGLHGGSLPPAASLLRTDPASFRLSAVYPERGGSIVVRGVLLADAPAEVRLAPLRGPRGAERVRLDGEALERLEPDRDGAVRVAARPNEIVSVRLHFGG